MSWVEEQSWFGLEDLVIDSIEQQEIQDNFLYKHIWTTYDGRAIYIKNMKTSHLINCINKIKRDNWRLYALPIFERGIKIKKLWKIK